MTSADVPAAARKARPCAICAAIAAEFDRLGVAEDERAMYEYTLGQQGDVLAQLRECTTRAELDKLTEDGVIP